MVSGYRAIGYYMVSGYRAMGYWMIDWYRAIGLGLHTGTRVPIGTEIRFEKHQYFTISLRTST